MMKDQNQTTTPNKTGTDKSAMATGNQSQHQASAASGMSKSADGHQNSDTSNRQDRAENQERDSQGRFKDESTSSKQASGQAASKKTGW